MKPTKKRTPPTVYGKWVYNRLMDENMTVKELGKLTGIQPQNMSNFLHGALPECVGYPERIAAVLGEPPVELNIEAQNAATLRALRESIAYFGIPKDIYVDTGAEILPKKSSII